MAKKYYKKIKNQNYDKQLLDIADAAIAGRGDGQISLDDAEKILWAVKDSGEYTDIEKKTIHYIRDNYKFTKKADTWFRKEIRSWAASKASAKKSKPVKSKSPKIKPIEEPEQELFSKPDLEPDPAYYQIQKTSIKKNEFSHKNKFYIITSAVILILFVLIYFLFLKLQCGKDTGKKETTINRELETNSKEEVKKKETIQPSQNEPSNDLPKIETKPKNLQGVKTIAGLNPKKINSESLLFDDSELYVNKKNRAFLRKMAEFLIGNPDLKVKVIGHTCNRGTDENNQKLSVERAESIIKYLKNQGVDSSRLTAIGEGERKPIADNSTKKGRIKNRRVQFEVIE